MRYTIMKIYQYGFFIILTIAFFSCNSKEIHKIHPDRALRTSQMKFVDQQGRHVILNGINLVDKTVDGDYLEEFSPTLMANFKEWGFNCIRLGIVWAGVEPKPGHYDEKYLSQVDQWLQYAAENEIMIVLDMHQDLYSMKYADGAPDWATLDEGKAHVTGQIWDDAYFLSPAVQTAFDNFWANKKVADGIGVQDHYINMWSYLAERYKNQNYLIGYDIMNEPFNGTEAKEIMAATFQNFAQVVLANEGEKAGSLEEIQQKWLDENERLKYYEYVDNIEGYKKLIQPMIAYHQKFESNDLQAMYQRAADVIRKYDKKKILFLEHGYYGNIGLPTAIKPVTTSNREIDPLVSYAAHCYDLLTDTKNVSIINNKRNEYIYRTIWESGKQMNTPVWVGEWGAFYSVDKEKGIKSAQSLINLIEKYKLGNAYWAYYNGLEEKAYFQEALIRPYPMYTAGELLKYDYDFENKSFTCQWQSSSTVTAPTVIFIPKTDQVNLSSIKRNSAISKDRLSFIRKNGYGYLIIAAEKDNKKQQITFILE